MNSVVEMEDEKTPHQHDGVISELGDQASGPESDLKRSSHGVVLVPQPSDDPKDPLNWPARKKYAVLATLCLAAFTAIAAPLAGLLALTPQAMTYHKTAVQMSYSVSAALAGMVVGPILFTPLTQKFGRSSVMFWSLAFILICNIWGALMTHEDQYIAFVISRLLAGLCGCVPTAFGPSHLTDLFFIHERGRAFSAFHLCLLMGPVAGPTIGGFIGANTQWSVVYWWTVGLLGLTLVCFLAFMEETGYDREGKGGYPVQPESFVANRVATFLPGNRIIPRATTAETIRFTVAPLIVGLTPIVLIMGMFTFISFGFQLMLTVLQNVFIEEPVFIGGFGFTLEQNSFYSFTSWIAVGASQIYGHLVNDRLPMYICKRRGGVWKPEYRLHCLWIPALIMLPIGLGIFGAALQYHLSIGVLALGTFLVVSGSMASAPIVVNYVIECYTHLPQACGIILNSYRLAFGLATSFFIDPWVAAVGTGWVFGMAAFFSILSFGFVVLLMWKGHAIRQVQLFKSVRSSSEEGLKIVRAGSS